MANENAKCPMCNTKLKMVDGRMTCKSCGYYVRTQEGETGARQASGYSQQSSDYSQSSGYTQQSSGYSQSSGQTRTSQTTSTKKNTSSRSTGSEGIAGKVASALIACVAFVGLVLLRAGVFDNDKSSNNYYDDLYASLSEEMRNSVPTITAAPIGNGSNSSQDGSGTKQLRLPQSSFFQQMSEAIWGKSFRSITAAEYGSLTALEIDDDNKVIYYQLNHGETYSLTYANSYGMQLSDLSCFSGLEWISLTDDDLSKGDLDGLDNLIAVYAQNTLDDYLKIIPHPENITDLGIVDSIFKHNLNGIENFPNLLYLSVDYGALEDISALKQLPGLLGLTLIDCNNLTDYSPLMSLTSLQELSIKSTQLKTIDFIKVMPDLLYLSIEKSQILNVNALSSCPMLESLTLIENGTVDDYSVIGDLTNLTSLTLHSYHGELPSFEKLTYLQSLSLKYFSDLTPLKDAVNVTYLRLERCSSRQLEVLTAMTELNTLVIHDFSTSVSTLEPLTRLPKLEALDMSDTNAYCNIEGIFSIPTMRYLNLDDCRVGIDFANMTSNPSLEVLSMNHITILDNVYSYDSRTQVSLSDHYDMFALFPNLTDLYVRSQQLPDIAFVEYLPSLQYLDITNNNVTSLKPLESLSNFVAVWCGKNTILENVSESSGIRVYTSD